MLKGARERCLVSGLNIPDRGLNRGIAIDPRVNNSFLLGIDLRPIMSTPCPSRTNLDALAALSRNLSEGGRRRFGRPEPESF
jgi:hypothetical protein